MSTESKLEAAQRLGPPVDATPALLPGPVTLHGRFGRVEPLGPAHAESLWHAVKAHDHIWTYMQSGPDFGNAAEFADWIAARIGREDAFFYTFVDGDDRAVGLAALMEIRLAMRVIEVGHVLLSPQMQRTPLATEAQYLLARYVFETLGYRRYEWKCHSFNAPSRRAALRFGFTFEGILRQHMISKGRSRDTAYYSMLDSEWPARKVAFECWLAPENFDAAGGQKRRLEDFRT